MLDKALGLRDKDFLALQSIIEGELGIRMPPSKKTMLESRLLKRLRAVGASSFSEYCAYLLSPAGQAGEMVTMLDAVTTNKTDFFREPEHFSFLETHVLPRWTRGAMTAWSAGCATGEEAYSLAMLFQDHAEQFPGFTFKILATDVSTRALRIAAAAVYDEQRIAPIDLERRRKYLLRSKEPTRRQIRISPRLRERVSFQHMNLMDKLSYPPASADVVLCRNVLIYFEPHKQRDIVRRLCDCLRPDGYLIVGHAESLAGSASSFRQVAPTIYQTRSTSR